MSGEARLIFAHDGSELILQLVPLKWFSLWMQLQVLPKGRWIPVLVFIFFSPDSLALTVCLHMLFCLGDMFLLWVSLCRRQLY